MRIHKRRSERVVFRKTCNQRKDRNKEIKTNQDPDRNKMFLTKTLRLL